MINEIGVYYLPGVAAARVRSASRGLSIAVVFFVGIAVFEVALVLGLVRGLSTSPWAIAGALCIVAVPLVLRFFTWRKALEDKVDAEAGLAVGINREGMMIRGQWFTWPQIGKAWLTPGRWSGSIRLLVALRDGQELWVPLSYTDTMPASLDTAIKTLSAGRVNVDISRLDS